MLWNREQTGRRPLESYGLRWSGGGLKGTGSTFSYSYSVPPYRHTAIPPYHHVPYHHVPYHHVPYDSHYEVKKRKHLHTFPTMAGAIRRFCSFMLSTRARGRREMDCVDAMMSVLFVLCFVEAVKNSDHQTRLNMCERSKCETDFTFPMP